MWKSERERIPEWAERERTRDLAWIRENLEVLWSAAERGYQALGKGVLVVDTLTVVREGERAGNPLFYVPQGAAEDQAWGEVRRMLTEYDPSWELVTVLLKKQRESAYRIGVPEPSTQST